MRAICARHGVLFIADEVMTGWGRTGTLLACEQAGIVPDILCLSKGLTGGAVPLAVTMATRADLSRRICRDDRARMFFHSSSYTANPIACAAAQRQSRDLARRAGARADRRSGRAAGRTARPTGGVARVRNARALGHDRRARSGGAGRRGYLSALGPRLLALLPRARPAAAAARQHASMSCRLIASTMPISIASTTRSARRSSRRKKAPGSSRIPRLLMVGVARIELATPAMSTQCSTTELHAHRGEARL